MQVYYLPVLIEIGVISYFKKSLCSSSAALQQRFILTLPTVSQLKVWPRSSAATCLKWIEPWKHVAFLLCTMIMHCVLCKHDSHYCQPAKFSLPWPRLIFRGWNTMHAFIFLSLSSLQYIRFCPSDDRGSWQPCEAMLLYASSCLWSSFLRHVSCRAASALLCHQAHSRSRWELLYKASWLEGRARAWC